MGNFEQILLHNAAKNRYLELAEELFDYKTDLNAKKNTKLTLLYFSIQYG